MTYQHFIYYLNKSQSVVDRTGIKPSVLKTDAYNESLDLPDKGGVAFALKNVEKVSIVEYDQVIVDKAKQLYPDKDIRTGDIRKLPFEDKEFNIVLDLSTIDHIPAFDLASAFHEYHRVLKSNGLLLIVGWMAENPMVHGFSYDRSISWNSMRQYFFDPKYFRSQLSTYFDIIEEELAIPTNTDSYLLSILAGRKEKTSYDA